MPKTSVKAPDPTITFDLTIPQDEIKKAYELSLKKVAASTELKGFRKGKAPLNVVADHVDQNKLYEMVFNTVFPPAYQDYLKTHQLHPVTSPRVEVKEAKTTTDWQFTVKIAEKPTVTLTDYQEAIKTEFAKGKIWVPGKDKAAKDEPKKEDRLNKIFEILLQKSQVTLSALLVDDEANRTLSRLLDQIGKLGLTLDQYVKSLGKSIEDLKAEHQQNAQTTLKLEYILEAVAAKEKINTTDKEFTQFLDSVKDPHTKAEITKNPELQAAIKYNLTKQKVVDFLQTLGSVS